MLRASPDIKGLNYKTIQVHIGPLFQADKLGVIQKL